MSLIRNSGFERGNTGFWEVDGTGALEISTSSPKHGTYCGKYTSDGLSYHNYVMNKDYLEVKPFDIVNISAWAKSAAAEDVMLLIKLYDAEYSFIDYSLLNYQTMDGTWMEIKGQFIVPPNCSYIQVGYNIYTNTDDQIYYLDAYLCSILSEKEGMSGHLVLFAEDDVIVSGDTDHNQMDMKQFSTYYADLEVSFSDGTNQTLDVDVYEGAYRSQHVLVGSFTQVTGVMSIERILLSKAIGNEMFIEYTIAGTTPTFNFQVDVTGKR